jgi:hypothetical protein
MSLDSGKIETDLAAGYMKVDARLANHFSSNGSSCVVPQLADNPVECREAMATAFMEEYLARQHWQCPGCDDRGAEERWSTELYDLAKDYDPEPNKGVGLGLCFSKRGTENGTLNLGLGMCMVVITLLREMIENVSCLQLN